MRANTVLNIKNNNQIRTKIWSEKQKKKTSFVQQNYGLVNKTIVINAK